MSTTNAGYAAITTSTKGEFVVPESVVDKSDGIKYKVIKIGSFAFYKCTEITSIKMSDSIEELGHSAFQHCEKLESIKLSKNIKKIGNSCFGQCPNLKSIEFPARHCELIRIGVYKQLAAFV